ncbi:lipocalin/fatty acid-binding family protein [Pontibacter burrus]|uniref:Uncharacterized protein n=1 Tax=Pontibacter burrus TaxID=2704466 RepID=A0A6B3LY94_9BACT|nr:hypothetical protein [Pontibacter burrus]NEM99326.1 hypothetical protein [Pontibacter burrus]
MKIVCDTNIWYHLGEDEALFQTVKDLPLAPSFINIYELTKTPNFLGNEEKVRSAIQKMFYFQKYAIFEPPFIHVAKMHNSFDYDLEREVGVYLKFTELVARGETIRPEKLEDFKKFIELKRLDLEKASSDFNEIAVKVKREIKDKRVHSNQDTSGITGAFINFCVEWATGGKYNLEGFNLNNIELLIRVLDLFFLRMEVSSMKIGANDWNDFAILSYVQPGDKYWTKEKRWLRLIAEAGMENYIHA